MTYILLM